jgi:PHD/YefM family antitoxin component YafN of YafNO toxin-antitoxin module
MLKKVAILATFETFSLQERRELLSKLVEKSDVILNDHVEENILTYNVEYNLDEKFNKFLFASFTSKIIFFKEDICKCYRLFQIIKEKCNYVLWRRDNDDCIRDTFCLCYRKNSNKWEVKVKEEKDPSYPIGKDLYETSKENFFKILLEYCNNGCFICLMNDDVPNNPDYVILYESLYDLTIREEIYNRFINEWNLPKYSEI